MSFIRIYNIHHEIYGNIVGYKEIFVAQGFSQKEDIHYKETLAPVTSQVYIEQPLGVETHDRQIHVCKIKKVVYKLRRHP